MKAKTLLLLSRIYSNVNVDRSMEYGKKALSISEKLKWNMGMAQSYYKISYAYSQQGDFSEALKYRFKELAKWKELNRMNDICITLGNIGISYSDMGNNTKAMEYYMLSLDLARKTKNTLQTINTLCNIATIYKVQGNYKKAFEYYTESLNLAEDQKDEQNIAINRGNLGSLFSAQNKYHMALESYLIALEIDSRVGSKSNVVGWLINIGDVYQNQGDSADRVGNAHVMQNKRELALEYYNKAAKKAKDIGNEYLEAFAFCNAGNLCVSMNAFNEAEKYLRGSLGIAKKINSQEVIMDSYLNFYTLYSKTKEYDKALDNYERYISVKDSLANIENSRIISELQVKFETEKKETENRSLLQENKLQSLAIKNQRITLATIGILFILLCAVGFLIIRQNKLKSQQLAIQFEQKLLRTQMNPHFIFNSLASIESFIYDHQPKEAGIYLSSFSRLMRLILEYSSAEFVTIEKEIEIVNHYLTLQKMRLDDNLTYEIHVTEEINIEQTYLPPMLTQPFIENAIEHGFRGSKKAGEVKISFSKIGDKLQVQIVDNGVGIEKALKQKEDHEKHQSMAMQITSERLAFLNKSKRKKLSFVVSDMGNSETGITGTKITFLIPLSH
ncbi:MAG: tetratricopeptide repeat protein [Bacteroidia bacterium]